MARQSAENLAVGVLALSLVLFFGPSARSEDAVERVVLLRHGEKPKREFGQLDCQGLNRALALPAVIAKTFGTPNAIFAPDPNQQVHSQGVSYSYVRPLATIEPTAIVFGLPVDVSFGMSNVDGLPAALEQPRYENALVLVAWEHRQIAGIARALLLAHGGDARKVLDWDHDDFDSFYVVKIAKTGASSSASFDHLHQDLDRQPKTFQDHECH
jgi:hypothetical protein